ncbi:MAG: hypothetical protein QNJ69_03520 [Gammaproteobacteria bacterium]|nr:hypothetical protein [Gammaproteobacteria bacterium]
MKQVIHLFAALIATLCIGTFFVSTIVVELFASLAMITTVKGLIVSPGLFILVPAIAITGATGFALSSKRKAGLIDNKKRRMPFIAANGILILLPAAIYLDHLATTGNFGLSFYLVQGLELIAGGINLTLMSLNMRDGFRLSGRLRRLNQTAA